MSDDERKRENICLSSLSKTSKANTCAEFELDVYMCVCVLSLYGGLTHLEF